MSTYLAAWAVLPDTYGQRMEDQDGIPVRERRDGIDLSIIMCFS